MIERIRSRVTPAELTSSVAPAHAGNGATEGSFHVPPIRQLVEARSIASVGLVPSVPNDECVPSVDATSVARTILLQRWWILGGAFLGAAVTLGLVRLFGN